MICFTRNCSVSVYKLTSGLLSGQRARECVRKKNTVLSTEIHFVLVVGISDIGSDGMQKKKFIFTANNNMCDINILIYIMIMFCVCQSLLVLLLFLLVT